jgi:hypothetical protein
MFDENYYSEYYDLDDLKNELCKNNLTINDLKNINEKSELFYFAIEKGLYNLVEHLYIDCLISYNLTILLNMIEPNKICNTSNSLLGISQETSGIHEGLKLNYLDNHTDKINKIISRLIYLRKYSKSVINGKDYIYTFNVKYRDNI